MLQAFTRNYHDNSTDAGFEFTFYCDCCQDGYKSSFIESDTYKKKSGLRGLAQGVGILGSLVGGRASRVGYAAERGGSVLSQRFEGKSPEWHKEHEKAFTRCQNEVMQHFHRCPSCNTYACDHCLNEDEGLCVTCAPRQEVLVAKTRADAMKRNLFDAGQTASVWQGQLESKTTICTVCGKPAGKGKFCNNCGSDMSLKKCPRCGEQNAQTIRFCNHCGQNLSENSVSAGVRCGACGFENQPGTKFCGDCGNRIG